MKKKKHKPNINNTNFNFQLSRANDSCNGTNEVPESTIKSLAFVSFPRFSIRQKRSLIVSIMCIYNFIYGSPTRFRMPKRSLVRARARVRVISMLSVRVCVIEVGVVRSWTFSTFCVLTSNFSSVLCVCVCASFSSKPKSQKSIDKWMLNHCVEHFRHIDLSIGW